MKFVFVALVFMTVAYNYAHGVDISDLPEILNGNFAAFDEVLEHGEDNFLPWRPRVLTLRKCKKMIHAKCTKYSHLYKLLQCLFEKWYCGGVISNGVCHANKRPYIDGQMIKRDCNTCQCVITAESKIGSFHCTVKKCVKPTSRPATTLSPGYCISNGRRYERGARIKMDCNTCVCYALAGHIGEFGCTRKFCPRPTINTATVGKLGYCLYKGTKIMHGTKLKKDCNTCTCYAMANQIGNIVCTNKFCTGFCFHNGISYKNGETMKRACNTCTCKAPTAHVGSFFCTNKLCGVTAPPHPTRAGRITLSPKNVVTGGIIQPTHHGVKTDAKRIGTTVAPMTPAALRGCFLHGRKYKRGEIVKRKCKTCVCVVIPGEIYGIFSCKTKKSCLVVTPRTVVTRPTRRPIVTKPPQVKTLKPFTIGPTRPRVITKAPTRRPVITTPPKHACYYILRENCYTNMSLKIFRCFWKKWFCRSGRLPGHYNPRNVPVLM